MYISRLLKISSLTAHLPGVVPIENWPVPVVVVNTSKVILKRTVSRVLALASPGLVVYEILRKHSEVQEERDKRAGQPAEVDEHVPAVDVPSLTRLTGRLLAVRLIGKDGQDICDVAQARKEEEEHAKAICRLASPVENELWQARENVGDGAEPAKDLPQHVELQRRAVIVRVVAMIRSARCLLAQEPAQDTGGNHHEHRNCIPDDGLQSRRRGGWWRMGDMWHCRG